MTNSSCLFGLFASDEGNSFITLTTGSHVIKFFVAIDEPAKQARVFVTSERFSLVSALLNLQIDS
jgi:hypothetical protein